MLDGRAADTGEGGPAVAEAEARLTDSDAREKCRGGSADVFSSSLIESIMG